MFKWVKWRLQTHIPKEAFGLFSHQELLLGLRVETVLAGQVAHDRPVLGHLDRFAIISLIDDVR